MLLKALAWLIPGGPILSALASVLSAIVSFFAWLLSKFTEGLTKMLANPVTFVTAGVLILLASAGGIRLGVKWDAHLVAKATKQLAERTKERDTAEAELKIWQEKYNEQDKRATAAEAAHKLAESKARAADAARQRAEQRLRNGTAADPKAGPKAPAGPGLPGLSSLFGGGK